MIHVIPSFEGKSGGLDFPDTVSNASNPLVVTDNTDRSHTGSLTETIIGSDNNFSTKFISILI